MWVNSVDLHVPLMVCCVIVYLMYYSLVVGGGVEFASCLDFVVVLSTWFWFGEWLLIFGFDFG